MAAGSGTTKPASVRWALLLSWSALAIAIGASLLYYATSGLPLVFSDVGSHLLGYAILAILLLGIGAGNPWARILFVIFLGWRLALGAINLLAESQQLPWPYALDLVILAFQAAASILLFRPSSNAWFRPR